MGNTNSGRGGLPREIRLKVERLIAAGHKNSHIARACGIDVSTVSRYKRRLRRSKEAEAASGEPETVGAETVRCGGCGGSILVSVGHCLKCYLDKTVFEPRRQARIERLSRRSLKVRIAA